jgi:DNA helicase IV
MTEIKVNNTILDNEQLKPILENAKYSLIVAGAGSGKTLTMVGKIKYLLDNNYCKPKEILAISFTNEAVNSLKNKIAINCGVSIPAFTFHRLALNILTSSKTTYKILSSDYLSYLIDEFFNTHCFNNSLLVHTYFKYYHILFKTNNRWNKLLNSQEHIATKKLIITYLNLFSSNNLNKNSWIGILKMSHKHERYLLEVIYAIYLYYIEEKQSSSQIDFDDMIKLATNEVLQSHQVLPYKYILIDEFQDTSLLRFNLIKAIIKNTNASLCCVGDDYQSIYHFSGCDLELFLNFSKIMPGAKCYKLVHTYRNCQELIDVAGSFINKNPYQVSKKLISAEHLNKPIKIVFFNNKNNLLINIIKMTKPQDTLFILGRNTFDIKNYLKDTEYTLINHNLVINKLSNYQIKYLTIHSAKGLEADNVIILNLADDIHGLPALQKDESILRFVKKSFLYPLEEERRLFYVGLTRTKHNVYLLTPQNNPSKFIKEIKYNHNVEIIKFN